MSTTPLPQGMSEHDYEAIEAAVTETVRGRWFLNEFARRTRAGELRQVLDIVTRLEETVSATAGSLLPAPADPSIRLLMQRIKDISGQLGALSRDMEAAHVDGALVARVEEQSRAVAGMLRSPPPQRTAPSLAAPSLAAPSASTDAVSALDLPRAPSPRREDAVSVVRQANAYPDPKVAAPSEVIEALVDMQRDRRLALLSGFDRLPVLEKLALFG